MSNPPFFPSERDALPLPSGQPLQLLGTSPAVTALRREIECASRTDAPVLVLGETGSGKEIVSRLIHAGGRRRARGFTAVNCGGIPEALLASVLFGHTRGSFTGAVRDTLGVLRYADGGTLFLDELGEMSLAMQAALLRFAENGEIQALGAPNPVGRSDVRLITATNSDLRARIDARTFREDLYYRLNIIEIQVPALRDRGNDVVELFEHYLAIASATHRTRCPVLEPCATRVLGEYGWPGNVRELKNVTERVVLRELPRLVADDLAREFRIRAATSRPAGRHESPQARPRDQPATGVVNDDARQDVDMSTVVDELWRELMAGNDFWTVVRARFKAREISRLDLRALIDRGLRRTQGSYRGLVALFNLPAADYKRFHAFLYSQRCNLGVAEYRPGLSLGARSAVREEPSMRVERTSHPGGRVTT